MEGKDETNPEEILFFNLTTTTTVATNQTKDLFLTFPGKNSPYTPIQAILITLVLVSIIIGTVIGNILVCVAVFLVRKLRRPCNYLLVSLAVSDLCVALLVMPMALLYEISHNWTFGEVICDLWVSFDVLSCTASILNLCMISLDRYWAITKPLKYGVQRTPKRMMVYVLLVWLVAACVSLTPLLFIENAYTYSETGPSHCTVCQNFYYQIYATVLSFYVPLTVMIMVYYRIFRAARKIVLEERRAQSHLETQYYLDIEPPVQHQTTPAINRQFNSSELPTNHGSPLIKQHRSSSASTTCSGNAVRCFAGGPRKSNESQCPMLQKPILSSSTTTMTPSIMTMSKPTTVIRNHLNSTCSVTNSPHQKKLRFHLAKERKASTTLGIIMSAFIICWLPFFVLALIRAFLTDPQAVPTFLSSLFLWLGYCNSLLNPIIYVTLTRDFRKPFREILCFRCSSLNHMMREEFYQSQYGDPVNNYEIKAGETESGDRLDDQGVESIDVVANTPNESFL
ncbi:PREDICTED: 5-hydroxytryptamine receptor 1-like isoform X2 [Polistes canadensis]|uniref:5-hydroxytryptamine receptor 1-like isoform X2 n=1 Tax=Polistes canadensis TaxID=91411 RepID=UPI000718E503|nr:PREDICTED: 5-hydroxytryptamine receptor 1-like isoform X2 [Polistes canadensis]